MIVLRAALYPRVSTEEQAKFGLSIHDQQRDLEEYAKAHGMKIVGIYPDAGFSARKKIEKRPAMMELLAAVQRNEIDIILVTKLDRWFRNIGEYYKVQEILEAHNVCWKTIYEDYDTSTAAGRLKINIMLAVAQDEADRTGERIKKVLDAKKSRNEVCTGHLPKGYKIGGKFAVIDRETEPDVKTFFSVFLETGSIHNAISAVPNLKLQYLTAEEFDRIQTLRRRLQRKVAQNRTYIFSGLLVCGDCGRRIGGRPRKLVNGESYVYSCDGAYQYKGCPNHANIMEATIEQYLLETIDAKIEIFANTKDEPKQDSKEIEEKAKSLQKKLAKLSDLYLDDLISKGEYAKRYADLTAQLESAEALLRKPPVKSAKDLSETFFSGWQDIYKELSRENKKVFWKLKLKEIRLYQDRRIDFDFL